jgi:hypothetical protein
MRLNRQWDIQSCSTVDTTRRLCNCDEKNWFHWLFTLSCLFSMRMERRQTNSCYCLSNKSQLSNLVEHVICDDAADHRHIILLTVFLTLFIFVAPVFTFWLTQLDNCRSIHVQILNWYSAIHCSRLNDKYLFLKITFHVGYRRRRA